MTDAPVRALLVGAPGAGKRTQAAKMQENHCLCNLNLSSLFREAVMTYNAFHHHASPHASADARKPPSRAQTSIAESVRAGTKMQDNQVIDLILEKALSADCKNGFILHGFPRTDLQSITLFETFKQLNIPINKVFHLDFPFEDEFVTLRNRLDGRVIHPASSRSYHLVKFPSKIFMKDDITQEGLVRYSQDVDAEGISRQRIGIYYKQAQPLLSKLKQICFPPDCQFYNIKADSTAEDLFNEISSSISEIKPST